MADTREPLHLISPPGSSSHPAPLVEDSDRAEPEEGEADEYQTEYPSSAKRGLVLVPLRARCKKDDAGDPGECCHHSEYGLYLQAHTLQGGRSPSRWGGLEPIE